MSDLDSREFHHRLSRTISVSVPAAVGPDGRGWRIKKEGTGFIVLRMGDQHNNPGQLPTYFRSPNPTPWTAAEALAYAIDKANTLRAETQWVWEKMVQAATLPVRPSEAEFRRVGVSLQDAFDFACKMTMRRRRIPAPNAPDLDVKWYVYLPKAALLPDAMRQNPRENFQGLLPLHAERQNDPRNGDVVVVRKGDVIGLIKVLNLPSVPAEFSKYLVLHPAASKTEAFAGSIGFAGLIRTHQLVQWEGDVPVMTPPDEKGQPPAPVAPALQPATPPPPAVVPTRDGIQAEVLDHFKTVLRREGIRLTYQAGYSSLRLNYLTRYPMGKVVWENGPADPMFHFAESCLESSWRAIREGMASLGETLPGAGRQRGPVRQVNPRIISSNPAVAPGDKDPPLVLTHGSRVLALYPEDGLWYPATFKRYSPGSNSYLVKWDDGGNVEPVKRVKPSIETVPVEQPQPGMVVEVWYEEEWWPAKVVSVMAGTPFVTVSWITDDEWHGQVVQFDVPPTKLRVAPPGTVEQLDDFEAAAAGNDARKIDYLTRLWYRLNDTKFGGQMRMPGLGFLRNAKIDKFRRRGHWIPNRRMLEINRRLFNNEAATYEVFLHEMCHQAVTEIDRATTAQEGNGGHGPRWTAWMTRVGLDPSRYDSRDNLDYADEDEKQSILERRNRWKTATEGQERIDPAYLRPGRRVKWYNNGNGVWTVGRTVAYEGGKFKFWACVAEVIPADAPVIWQRVPVAIIFQPTAEESARVSGPEWDATVERVRQAFERRRADKRMRRLGLSGRTTR